MLRIDSDSFTHVDYLSEKAMRHWQQDLEPGAKFALLRAKIVELLESARLDRAVLPKLMWLAEYFNSVIKERGLQIAPIVLMPRRDGPWHVSDQ
jgi:hypothetical protein